MMEITALQGHRFARRLRGYVAIGLASVATLLMAQIQTPPVAPPTPAVAPANAPHNVIPAICLQPLSATNIPGVANCIWTGCPQLLGGFQGKIL